MTRFLAGRPIGPHDGVVYVERPALRQVVDLLGRGESCLLAAPTQTGKTSLLFFARAELEEAGARTALVDLLTLGTGTADQWLRSLRARLREELALDAVVEPDREGTPIDAWDRFLREELLALPGEGRVVILLDEINALAAPALAAVREDFLSSLRALPARRQEDPRYARLAFCLAGFMHARELVTSPERGPFTVFTEVTLGDLAEADAAKAFVPVLEETIGKAAPEVFAEIYAWTAGHPYFMQKLCSAAIEHEKEHGPPEEGGAKAWVHAIVEPLFPTSNILDPTLHHAESRIKALKNDDQAKALEVLADLHAGREVASDVTNDAQIALRYGGLVKVVGGRIEFRSRIVSYVFHAAWVRDRLAKLSRPLAADIERWRAHPDYLLTGTALETAKAQMLGREATREELEFLQRSGEREASLQRQRGFYVIGFALSLAGALGLIGWRLHMASKELAMHDEAKRKAEVLAGDAIKRCDDATNALDLQVKGGAPDNVVAPYAQAAAGACNAAVDSLQTNLEAAKVSESNAKSMLAAQDKGCQTQLEKANDECDADKAVALSSERRTCELRDDTAACKKTVQGTKARDDQDCTGRLGDARRQVRQEMSDQCSASIADLVARDLKACDDRVAKKEAEVTERMQKDCDSKYATPPPAPSNKGNRPAIPNEHPQIQQPQN